MNVLLKKLHPEAKVPTYASTGAGCFDLYAVETVLVESRHAQTIPTGLAFEVPEGFSMLVFSRSGHGFKNGLRLANCVGVIDADYRGELHIRFHNDSARPYTVKAGERVAQAMILPVPKAVFKVVDNLTETARGANGLGSTGK